MSGMAPYCGYVKFSDNPRLRCSTSTARVSGRRRGGVDPAPRAVTAPLATVVEEFRALLSSTPIDLLLARPLQLAMALSRSAIGGLIAGRQMRAPTAPSPVATRPALPDQNGADQNDE
jgi:hypothetical protein